MVACPCDMDELHAMAKKSISVIEDAAQALGATYKGKKYWGDIRILPYFLSRRLSISQRVRRMLA